MRRNLRMMLMLCVMGLGASACGAESEPAEAPPVEEPVTETPAAEEPVDEAVEPVVEAEEVAPSAEELPIAEDFEEEMREAITSENYDDVLAQIEAELETDE